MEYNVLIYPDYVFLHLHFFFCVILGLVFAVNPVHILYVNWFLLQNLNW